MADETTQAPSMPVYVVRPVFDDRYDLRNSYGSPLNGSEMRYAARAVNAFEPMREVLRALEWDKEIRGYGWACPWCDGGKEDGGHTTDCALAAALRAADGEGQTP